MIRKPDDILDELLVMRIQNGDRDAFSILFRKWNQILLHRVFLTTGQSTGAQDIVQESWATVAKSLGTLKDPTKFRAWLFRIVHHKSVDWIRDMQKTRRIKESYVLNRPTSEVKSNEDDTASILVLRQALPRLPDSRRSILLLFYRDRLSVADIAAVLQVPPGTVKSRLFKARKALLKEFQNIKSGNYEKE